MANLWGKNTPTPPLSQRGHRCLGRKIRKTEVKRGSSTLSQDGLGVKSANLNQQTGVSLLVFLLPDTSHTELRVCSAHRSEAGVDGDLGNLKANTLNLLLLLPKPSLNHKCRVQSFFSPQGIPCS